jgi:hypothetical protein
VFIPATLPPKATAIPAPALACNAAEFAGPDSERETNVLLVVNGLLPEIVQMQRPSLTLMRADKNPAANRSFG